MSAPDNITASAAIMSSWHFARDNWRRALPALLIYAGANAYLALMAPHDDFGVRFRALFVFLIGSLVGSAAVLRLAVRDKAEGFMGMDFGMDELRLLRAYLQAMLFFMCIILATSFVMGVMLIILLGEKENIASLATSLETVSPPVGLVLLVMLTGMLAFLIWLWCRLCLYPVATIGTKRALFMESWPWTKGHARTIFIAISLLFLPWPIMSAWLMDKSTIVASDDILLIRWVQLLPPALLDSVGLLFYAGMSRYFYHRLVPQR